MVNKQYTCKHYQNHIFLSEIIYEEKYHHMNVVGLDLLLFLFYSTMVAQPASSWIDDYFDWLNSDNCCRLNGTGGFCPSTAPSKPFINYYLCVNAMQKDLLPKKIILRNKHTYINKNASYEGNLCWIWKKKQHNIGFPTFKLPTSTKHLLRLTH